MPKLNWFAFLSQIFGVEIGILEEFYLPALVGRLVVLMLEWDNQKFENSRSSFFNYYFLVPRV